MTRTAALPPLFSLQLQPGRRVWEHLPRAVTLTVTGGSIVVHQRRWLADTWVGVPVAVQAGEQLRMDAAGWVEMEAIGSTQAYASAAPAWWNMGRLWEALLQKRGPAVEHLANPM